MTDYKDPIFEGKPLRRPELDPAEEDAISAQVNADIEAGRGHRHFEDVFDELHSTQARPTNEPDAQEKLELEKYEQAVMWQLKRDVTEQLLSHGMRVTQVVQSREFKGFEARIIDRDRREFTAGITFDESNLPADVDGKRVYMQMVDSLVERAIGARKRYFERMCLTVGDEPRVISTPVIDTAGESKE